MTLTCRCVCMLCVCGLCRRLFERVINLKLSAKKMKFFFKRYLEFEMAKGDESTVEHVKRKAMEYVESRAG